MRARAVQPPHPPPPSTLSVKTIITLLAGDMGADPDAVKAHKDALKTALEGFMLEEGGAGGAGGADAAAEPAAEAAAEDKEEEEEEAAAEDGSDDDEDDSAPDAGAASDASTPPKPKKKRAPAAPKAKVEPRTLTEAATKMKAIARAAGVAVPPGTYGRAKTDAEVEEALEAALGKHGLSATSDAAAARAVKKSLAAARELDGMDASNVLSPGDTGPAAAGGRRPRGARVDYRKVLETPKLDSDDSEGESDDDGGDDDDASDASGAESDGSPSPSRKRLAKKARATEEPEDEEEKEEKEEKEEAAGGDAEEEAEASSGGDESE